MLLLLILGAVLLFMVARLVLSLRTAARPTPARRSRNGAQPAAGLTRLRGSPGASPRPTTDQQTNAARSDPTVPQDNTSSVNQQIAYVAAADFDRQRLLNHSEYRLLLQLESILPRVAPDHRLMAQVSLPEVIRPRGDASTREWKRAFHAINAKRLDFAVFDRGGYLACAIEFQGSGHYLDAEKTFVRDAVKREALRRAGIPLIEIDPSFKAEDVEATLRRHFRAARAS
ncbi:DUF2726 domain-containing protein [Marinibacterium profundimaris]|uniref:DUF2726 domain-containing protein n=1 Tax=Marinibacterium profundimaris TaxID=1679460 RepID=UPI001303DD68|nr:DUF2726 domain-containing protein [Marinibacterium profundimaris]